MNLEHISELISSGGNQHYPSTRTIQHLRTIKEHGPVLRVNLSRQLLFNPLGDEICYCLGLDGFLCLELDIKGKEFADFSTRPVASLLCRISNNGASLTTVME